MRLFSLKCDWCTKEPIFFILCDVKFELPHAARVHHIKRLKPKGKYITVTPSTVCQLKTLFPIEGNQGPGRSGQVRGCVRQITGWASCLPENEKVLKKERVREREKEKEIRKGGMGKKGKERKKKKRKGKREKERGRGCVARTQEPAEGLLFAQSGTQLQLPEWNRIKQKPVGSHGP